MGTSKLLNIQFELFEERVCKEDQWIIEFKCKTYTTRTLLDSDYTADLIRQVLEKNQVTKLRLLLLLMKEFIWLDSWMIKEKFFE